MRSTPLVLFVASLSLAMGSSVGLAGDDDIAFAKALAQRGYGDLAERVLRRTLTTSNDAAKKAESRLVLAQLRRFEALAAARARGADRPPAEVILRLFREAEAEFRVLCADPLAARGARSDLARLLCVHAEFMTSAAPNESTQPALDEALRLATDAESAARSDASSRPEGSPERTRAEDEIAALRLLRIQALCAKGTASPAGRAALMQALDEIEKFTWDYVGTLRCAWAFRWKGVVLAGMKRDREACESLRDAATAVTEQDGVRGADEMALAAYEDLARIAAATTGPEAEQVAGAAVITAERLDTDWPHHLATPAGRRARLAIARLHGRVGDGMRAASDARAVLVAAGDEDPEAADEACRLLADSSRGAAGPSGLEPEVLARVVRAAAQGDDVRRTVNACRRLIAACTTPELTRRFAWDAWTAMGRAYGAAGRWHEAYLAFDRIERAWRADPADPRLAEATDSTAFFRADALARLASETSDPADQAAAERAMSEFGRDHPESTFAPGAREDIAFRAMSEAAAMRRAGDAAGAERRLREAIQSLSAIGPDSPMAERAQAGVAEAHRRLGELDEAIRLAQAWLDAPRGEPPSAGARRSRDQGHAQALVTLLTAKADRAAALPPRDPGRAAAFLDLLATLASREAEFAAFVPKGRDQFDAWRAEGLLGTGDADAAEPLVLGQIRNRPSHPETRFLAVAAARADEDAAEKLRTAGDAARAGALSLRAAKLWEFVLQSSEVPDADVARAAGLGFRAGGDFVHAADLLSLATGLYRGAAEKTSDAARRAELLDSARSASTELARVLVVLKRYDEAASEAEGSVTRDEPEGADALAKLVAGEQLTKGDVEWVLRRAARSRGAMDVLAAAHAGAGTKERLTAAVQVLSALRYTQPRNAEATAETVDLAIRHADALLALSAAGGRPDAAPSAASILEDSFGTTEALARADVLVPGARQRIADLRKRLADAMEKR